MSEFTDSGERVEGASGLSIFFRSLRPKEKPRAVVIPQWLLRVGGRTICCNRLSRVCRRFAWPRQF